MHGQWWIAHPHAELTLARLDDAFQFGPGRIRPPDPLVIEPTNNGKSMIAEKFRRLHPSVPSQCGQREVMPIVVMQMATEPSIRRLYASIITALNAPISFNLPGERLERYALDLLRTVEVRMLMVDELHNLLAGTQRRRAEFLNMLRFVGNTLRIPIVGLGTKQAQIAVRSDDQLEIRFEPILLPTWAGQRCLRAPLGQLRACTAAARAIRSGGRAGIAQHGVAAIDRSDR